MKHASTLLAALITLLISAVLGFAQTANPRVEVTPPGSTLGGITSFDARVDCPWRVVGPRWQEVVADPANAHLAGRARSNGFFLDYSGEPFTVPAGIPARVPLRRYIWETPAAISAVPPEPIAPANQWVRPLYDLLFLLAVLAAACTIYFFAVVLPNRRREEAERQRLVAEAERQRLVAEAEAERQRLAAEAERQRRMADPVGSGPAIIPGGLDTVPQTKQYFHAEDRALAAAAFAAPGTTRSDWVVIPPVAKVRLFSDGTPVTVEYADGRHEEKLFNGEVVCDVTLRHRTTGEEARAFVLWACCNGCWLGRVQGSVRTEPVLDNDGRPVELRPIILATAADVARYSAPTYDPAADADSRMMFRTDTGAGRVVAGALDDVATDMNGGKPVVHPFRSGFGTRRTTHRSEDTAAAVAEPTAQTAGDVVVPEGHDLDVAVEEILAK